MSKETIYWGVLCRKCSEPIAFGAPSHQQFQLESAFAKPGAIRCWNGHTYIYFPRDSKFFASIAVIPEAVMLGNREAHRATNPPPHTPSDNHGVRWVAGEDWASDEGQAAASVEVVAKSAGSPANYERDPRRQTAQAAARAWWAQWALKKVS